MIDYYIKKSIDEINTQSNSLTQQYLEVHSVVRENDLPKVARVEYNQDKETVIVYFPIEGEHFYLAIYFDSNEKSEVRFVNIEAGNRVYFRVTSDTLSLEELCSKTTLTPIDGFTKGQFRKDKKSNYNFSALHFDPYKNEAYAMEYKIELLLNELEKDREGVKYLTDNFNGSITVASYRHIHNFGGIHLNKKMIQRLQELGLEIDFDIYVSGRLVK
jgi:Domain of unknown function (DUF4279)